MSINPFEVEGILLHCSKLYGRGRLSIQTLKRIQLINALATLRVQSWQPRRMGMFDQSKKPSGPLEAQQKGDQTEMTAYQKESLTSTFIKVFVKKKNEFLNSTV